MLNIQVSKNSMMKNSIIDLKWCFLSWNKSYVQLWGYLRENSVKFENPTTFDVTYITKLYSHELYWMYEKTFFRILLTFF